MSAASHTFSPKTSPAEDFLASRQFDADFSACGEIEFDEIDDADMAVELGFLAERVRVARSFGA